MVSTWPKTKCPPNSLPAVSGCSRLTRAPFRKPAAPAPNVVLLTVSPERSAEKRAFSRATTVRQQPLTAMLLETARELASVGAWMVTRPPAPVSVSDSIVPKCSMMTVNMLESYRKRRGTGRHTDRAQRSCKRDAGPVSVKNEMRESLAIRIAKIALDAKIGTILVQAQALQRKIRSCGEMSERDAGVAREFWREEERNLVYKIARERDTVERGAGFKKDADDFASREFGDDSGEIDESAPRARAKDFNSGILQLARFGRLEFRMSEDDEIVISGFHDAAIRGNAEFGIEDDPLKTPAAFESAAIGEKRVVGDDRADAREQRIGRVAHAVNFGA